MKREDLQAVLYDAALANGAVVSFNKTVKTVDEDKPAVHLDDGTSVHADLIIAADGNEDSFCRDLELTAKASNHTSVPKYWARTHSNRSSTTSLHF